MRGMVLSLLIRQTRLREVAYNGLSSPQAHKKTSKMPAEADPKQDKAANAAQARQVIDLFHEISTLLVRLESLNTPLS